MKPSDTADGSVVSFLWDKGQREFTWAKARFSTPAAKKYKASSY